MQTLQKEISMQTLHPGNYQNLEMLQENDVTGLNSGVQGSGFCSRGIIFFNKEEIYQNIRR